MDNAQKVNNSINILSSRTCRSYEILVKLKQVRDWAWTWRLDAKQIQRRTLDCLVFQIGMFLNKLILVSYLKCCSNINSAITTTLFHYMLTVMTREYK
jgi:hypothetical protein